MIAKLQVMGLPVVLLCITLSGCNTVACVLQGTSDALNSEARKLQVIQARSMLVLENRRERAKERREAKALEECCEGSCDGQCKEPKRRDRDCLCEGELAETLQTELNVVLENGLELEGVQIDFEKVAELAKEQARYDEDYEKAMDAWHDMEKVRAEEHSKLQASAVVRMPAVRQFHFQIVRCPRLRNT